MRLSQAWLDKTGWEIGLEIPSIQNHDNVYSYCQMASWLFVFSFLVTSGNGCSCRVRYCCVLHPLMWLLRFGKLLQTLPQNGQGIKTGLACFLSKCSFAWEVCLARCPHFLQRIFQRSPGTSTFSSASHKSDESVNKKG